MRRPGAMSDAQIVQHLHREADKIEELVPVKETPLAFVGAIGVPLVDWALASMPYDDPAGEQGNTDAIRIALETMRGMMLGIAETY